MLFEYSSTPESYSLTKRLSLILCCLQELLKKLMVTLRVHPSVIMYEIVSLVLLGVGAGMELARIPDPEDCSGQRLWRGRFCGLLASTSYSLIGFISVPRALHIKECPA